MLFHYGLCNGKTQSVVMPLTVPVFTYPVEPVKQMPLLLGRDGFPFIFYAKALGAWASVVVAPGL